MVARVELADVPHGTRYVFGPTTAGSMGEIPEVKQAFEQGATAVVLLNSLDAQQDSEHRA